ncbi:MAG: hypothetical protein SGPRY_000934 [Prymnesium sp.]
MKSLYSEFGSMIREASFLDNPQVSRRTASSLGETTFLIEASAEWQPLPRPSGVRVLTPSNLRRGATDEEVVHWFSSHANTPLIHMGDMTGRLELAHDGPGSSTDGLSARLNNGVKIRDDTLRLVEEHVKDATPFECLCLQHAGIDLDRNLTSIISHFAMIIDKETTVFVAGYRMDVIGIAAFDRVWRNVHALALYDWNGVGLQGRQLSSAINRLICKQAEKVHSWVGRIEESGECF